MATVFDPNKKDDKNNQQGQPNDQGSVLSSQTQANATAGGAPTAAQPQRKASSGSFTNVQKFIRANRPDQFAGRVAGKIGGNVANVRGNLQQGVQQFQQSSEAGRADSAENVQASENILSDPTKIGNIIKSGGYSGAQGIEGIQGVRSSARNAQALGRGLNTFSGTAQALGQLYNRPNYSSGQRRFDSMLLGQDRSGQLQKVSAETQRLAQEVDSADQQALQRVEQLKASGSEFVKDLIGKAGEEADRLQKEAKEAANARTQQDQVAYDSLTSKLKSGQTNFTPQELQLIGLSAGDQLYMSPSEMLRYLQARTQGVSTSQAMTPEMKARLDALQGIIDSSGSAFTDEFVSGLKGKTDFGQVQPGMTFQGSQFQSANQAKQQQYQQHRQHYTDIENDVKGISDKLAFDKKMLEQQKKIGAPREQIEAIESKIKQRETDLAIQTENLKKMGDLYSKTWGNLWSDPSKFQVRDVVSDTKTQMKRLQNYFKK